ncbi:MAG: hypothetical protein RR382_02950 [Tannerellaceae bacterium]
MAQRIRPGIYEAMMGTSVLVYPQSASDSMGDTTDGPSELYYGYVYENTETVLNNLGKEELSHMQIYLRGEDADKIAQTSLVTCRGVIQSRIVARKVYSGRANAKVIGILYLP